jgi:hypothetical protein
LLWLELGLSVGSLELLWLLLVVHLSLLLLVPLSLLHWPLLLL